jgi:hypothetical protein
MSTDSLYCILSRARRKEIAISFISNTPLKLADESGIAAQRFIHINFSVATPEEKQDKSLVQKCLKESGEIVVWALHGLKRLVARGRFTQPASGFLMEQEINILGILSRIILNNNRAVILQRCGRNCKQTLQEHQEKNSPHRSLHPIKADDCTDSNNFCTIIRQDLLTTRFRHGFCCVSFEEAARYSFSLLRLSDR